MRTTDHQRRSRVVVTGAAGTIGRIILERLGDRFDLVAVTHRAADMPSVVAEISDLEQLLPVFDGANAVVHLAAAATMDAPWDAVLSANIVGARNVFEAAVRCGVPKVVFASSNHVVGMYEIEGAPAIYALDDPRLVDERTEVRPDSLYGVSKACGEVLGRYYSDRFGLSVISLRIGSVLPDDNPCSPFVESSSGWLGLTPAERYARIRATWLSHRDCARLIECALAADVRWAIVYGVSGNPRLFWDPRPARELLGFVPADRAPADIPPLARTSPARGGACA